MKKALKISGILLLILMLLAFIAPFIFKGKIIEIVKKEINANVNANVAFDDLGLSFFRHFPRVSVSLDNISVVGTDAFAGDTLIAAKEVDVAVNLMSIIRGSNIQVQKVFLKEPKLKALVNKEGLVSWDIMKPSEDTSADDTESDFRLELEHYEIQNGYLLYDDRQADTRAEIMGLYHSGSGNFTAEVFTLATKTKAEAVNFSYEAIPYLANTVADIKADIKIDNSTDTYTFDTKDVKLNDLRLNAAGSFQQVNDSTYYMDINFQTPGNEFKSILSMIPAIFKKDFDKIKTEGTAALNGMVKGTYSSTSIPAYDIHLEIKDGSFKYPDLPVPVNNIQVLANVKNSDGQTDNLEINIEKGHLEVEKEPFDFRLIFKNPETVQYIDAAIKGKLDLSQVMKFIKLDEGTALAGLIHADIQAKGRMKDLEQKSGPFTAAGFLNLSKLQFASKDFPQPIRNGEAKIYIENNGGIADQ
ncbi:MAG TPA: AsmA family protein, partial [Parasegetibacter sp.]